METKIKFEARNSLEQGILKLEKADFMLSHWIAEYGYSNNPDLNLILDWTKDIKHEGHTRERQKESVNWLIDYDIILNFIDIAKEYVRDANEILAETDKILKALPIENINETNKEMNLK
ncbi:hypothetical protein [Alkalibacter saccharofermentans]|uniref:Uncharacterized protein n=1 Tax=Alkalibacter saccharofermentans DSM 14828 TaxID=1120975 RepID=A0A1M4ZIJ3_9FIRM|nr:hypothetical protein [Alkalibacter saccharofermentans]SHF17612.1 hypothetical protein SAMN02746064_02055 [Alkalibacter saccharofermentans DSM 14828]